MNRKKSMSRVMSMLLCVVMLLGMLPVSVFAAETDSIVTESKNAEVAASTAQTTIWKYTTTLTSGKKYLIVNSYSGSTGGTAAHALGHSGTSATDDGVNIYTDSSNGTYILNSDVDSTSVWTLGGSDDEWTFENGGYYLSRTNNSLTFATSEAEWETSSSNSRLSNSDYYLRYYNNSWNLKHGSNDTRVRFYVEDTITTNVPGHVYSVEGADIASTAAVAGKTVSLSAALFDTPTNGSKTDITASSGLTPTYTVVTTKGDPSVISSINGSTATLSGTVGTAVVRVTYTYGDLVAWDEFLVTTEAPTYSIDITKGDAVVTGTTVPQKSVTATTTLQLGASVGANGESLSFVPEGATLEWAIPEEYHNIATVDQNGLISFKGIDGAFYVTVTLTVNGQSCQAQVRISASTTAYATPEDGTEDFPEYPNEGAVRYDKTATAVGNFGDTGMVQVELSMTGVPYTQGNEIDVVIMIDMSTSMYEAGNDKDNNVENDTVDRVTPARTSALNALETIVTNEDDTVNDNRVAVYTFNGYDTSNPQNYADAVDEVLSLQSYKNAEDETDLTKLTDAKTEITNWIQNNNTDSGTNYGAALEKCYSVLKAAKEEYPERKQFVIFVTDGEPTTGFAYETTGGGVADDGYNNNYNNGAADKYYTYTEYYSKQMRNAGVEVYSVGIQLENTNAITILKKIGGNSTGTAYSNAETHGDYAQFVDADESADKLVEIFEAIVNAIKQAATDVIVEDVITDDYTMVFDIPTGSSAENNANLAEALEGQEFYIEVVSYTLDEDHERTDAMETLSKVYLKDSNGDTAGGTYSAASDAAGTAYASPVFEKTPLGTKFYWTTAEDTTSGVSVTVDGTTYYFVAAGMANDDDDYDAVADKWFNMTSGAYAYGTINETTNTSDDLIIATPHFVYNAKTRMLVWTVEKVSTTELALRYFLYLKNSATEVGTTNEIPSGTYQTNEWATITYTNFRDTDCQQKFPVPQITWNGAQVSYTFYLVNAAGQPINKSGQVVDFANATFVTDIYTESVIWNRGDSNGNEEGESSLDVSWLANEKLPDGYNIYDEKAKYELHVYQTHEGTTVNDYFIISGSAAGTVNTENGNTVTSTETTKVYNTKAGTKYSTYGTYTNTTHPSIDFANTTVAFAVVWEPALVEDVVVVDYGLPVIINVVMNDLMQNTVTGIGLDSSVYGTVEMNTGVSTTSKLGNTPLVTDNYTISIENENSVRFTQTKASFSSPVTFYYESPVEFYEGSNKRTGYMYSSVTVIPATSIYYEENFFVLGLENALKLDENGTVLTDADGNPVSVADGEIGSWSQVTDKNYNPNATQDIDRPGQNLIGDGFDADNVYGFDSAYDEFTMYSLGSAMKVTVDAATGKPATAPSANFTFTGTGFDIVSLTDNDSGTIIVSVYELDTATNTLGDRVHYAAVDNYYGYAYYDYFKVVYTYDSSKETWTPVVTPIEKDDMGDSEGEPASPANGAQYTVYGQGWVADLNSTDKVWQVPVMKVDDLPYGTYSVKIQLAYMPVLDHQSDGKYSFWLDAIRIYDPVDSSTKVDEDTTVGDIYDKDHEKNPSYVTLKELLVDESNLSDGAINGVVFIDGKDSTSNVDDYKNPGPNNETYLAVGQGVAFKLKLGSNAVIDDIDSVQIGLKLAYGDTATLMLNGEEFATLTSATDRYYDLTDRLEWTVSEDKMHYESQPITLSNGAFDEDGPHGIGTVISITNLKAVGANWELTVEGEETETVSETSSASFAQTTSVAVEEETAEETSEVISMVDTGNGFRLNITGLHGTRNGAEQATKSLAYTSTSGTTDTTAAADDYIGTISVISDAETIETANAVMEKLYPEVEEEEDEEPEDVEYFEPDYFETQWVEKNGRSVLNIITSKDVDYITVNSKKIVKHNNSNKGYYTFVYTARANSAAAGYEVTLYNADGVASEATVISAQGN